MKLIRVPATSANLRPGFDSFGIAISLYLELEVLAARGLGSSLAAIVAVIELANF